MGAVVVAAPVNAILGDGTNDVTVTVDGAKYRLEMRSKVANASDAVINPSTEETLAAVDTKLGTIDSVLDAILVDTGQIEALLTTIDADTSTLAAVDYATDAVLQAVRDRIGEISATPAANTVQDRLKQIDAVLDTIDADTSVLVAVDYATQATLAAADVKLGTIDSVLDSIKDTDGIKKITDALPVGDNIIGRAKITDGTDVLSISTGGQAHTVLYDDVNNVAMAVNDGDPIPANTRSLLVSGIDQTGGSRRLELIEDEQEAGLYRLAITGKVSVQIPPPPEGGTKVTITADNPLSISQAESPHLTEYEIADGTRLVLQQVVAGCQGDPSADGSKVEVYYWDGTTEHLVDRIYVTGQTQFGNYPDTDQARNGTTIEGMPTAGEGTVRIYRSRLSNSSQEIDAVIRGYTI